MEIKLLQYYFGLKPLIEFHSAFINQITASGKKDTDATLLRRYRGFLVLGTGDHDALLGFLLLAIFLCFNMLYERLWLTSLSSLSHLNQWLLS